MFNTQPASIFLERGVFGECLHLTGIYRETIQVLSLNIMSILSRLECQVDMSKVLVSACLMGDMVRYDGTANTLCDTILDNWKQEGWIVSVCPEVVGGLSVPRIPAEIIGGQAQDVLAGRARIMNRAGEDVTAAFIKGAQQTLELALNQHVACVVLTENSPSCGSSSVYNGHFDGTRIPGMGITTCLLRQHGIKVFSQYQLEQANELLKRLKN
jgi:uncharacterized protein YbbK (DUF523 family)